MYQTSQQTSALCSVCRNCGSCGSGIGSSGIGSSNLEARASSAISYRGSDFSSRSSSFSHSTTFSYLNSGNTFSYTTTSTSIQSYTELVISNSISSNSISPYSRNALREAMAASTSSIWNDYRKGNNLFNLRDGNLFNYSKSDQIAYHLFKTKPEYTFSPDSFLKPGKGGKFVGKADEVKEFVEEAFKEMFENNFPDDIKISVLEEERFRKLTNNQNTIGLSINRRKLGLLSEIFVLNGSLGQVMLTIGHELGHVLTETLNNAHDEEAKAYAFSLMWMNVIKRQNIANLREAIVLNNPAENGLHNVAFNFVEKLVKNGRALGEVYLGLIKSTININIEPF